MAEDESTGEPIAETAAAAAAAETETVQQELRVIKRYSNRKLYDTKDSRYVTLLQIADMVRAGEEVQIIDNATKEDKTDITLALIISEELKAKPKDNAAIAACEQAIQSCILWKQPAAPCLEFALAGDLLLAGFDGGVQAYQRDSGKLVWEAPVKGRAYGLTAASGRLFVSTDLGYIYGFTSTP